MWIIPLVGNCSYSTFSDVNRCQNASVDAFIISYNCINHLLFAQFFLSRNKQFQSILILCFFSKTKLF